MFTTCDGFGYGMVRTSKPEYIPYIISALKQGPMGWKTLLGEVYTQIKPHLHMEDHIILPNGEPRWRNQATHMIDGLIQDGFIVKNGDLLSLRDA